MISLNVFFYMFVILFALIGAMRGWARELIVSFSVILAIFISTVLENFVPFVRDILNNSGPANIFWVRVSLLIALVFFGYQTPNIPKVAATGRFAREHLQDILLGFFFGAINGYLIWGTAWYYMHMANYPLNIILPPDPNTATGQASLSMLRYLPPALLNPPIIYIAVALAFVFVLVVFI
ncbi:CvpA family protein [uncultured Thermanaerothrix sp.]|uniref:CvpA family protein n=1 Tax=uncultured Thermanaerothrix sp. TaxID=1195149 RepID=UPI00262C06A7|nr:CvpA family protein [uncultured Thermanaerothrix sp.]